MDVKVKDAKQNDSKHFISLLYCTLNISAKVGFIFFLPLANPR